MLSHLTLASSSVTYKCNLRSKASTSQINPHIYFILDISGCFHISGNLLSDYISNILLPHKRSNILAGSPASSVYILQYCASHTITLRCTLLHYITICYLLFCHDSNFSYVKELTQRCDNKLIFQNALSINELQR